MDRSSAARVSLRRARSCCCSCWTPPIARAFKKGMIDIGQDAMWSVAICASSLSMGEKLLNDWYSMGLGPGGGCQAGKQVLGSHACQRERGFAKISHSPPWNSRRRPLRLASARRTIRNGHRRRGTSPSASSSTWVRRMAIPSMRSFPTATALCCNFSSIGALLATFRAIGSAMSASTLECMIFCLTFVFCFRHLASLFEILVRVHTYCASGNACLLVCVCVCSHCDYNAHT
mmetsp:Transcript_88671/g.286443  ORF Transcript_88671/g.286443 Transcript_88671/m.286443 type:complete len:232 (+) Transcript_88671:373-1068(+)